MLAGSLPVLLGGILMSAALGVDLLVQRLALDPLETAVARSLRAPGLGIGLVSVAAGFWVLRARRYPDLSRALCRLAIGIVPIYFLVLCWFMPRFNPVKTYEPAGRWIAGNVGSETVVGLANPRRGRAKMAAFGFYSRRNVELLDTEDAIERFLRDHPGSAALLASDATEAIYGPANSDWHLQVVKELMAGGDRYFVLRRR